MPTERVKTIRASGGDYTSLSAWQAGELGLGVGDLVARDEIAVAECYNDWTGNGLNEAAGVTISGWTTDATRYVCVRPAPGHGHKGMPGTGFRINRATGTVLTVSQAHTLIDGIEVIHTLDSNGFNYAVFTTVQCTIRNVIGRAAFVVFSSDSNSLTLPAKWIQCLALPAGPARAPTGFGAASAGSDYFLAVNCVVGDGCATGFAISNLASFRNHTLINCVAYSCSTASYTGAANAASSNNAATDGVANTPPGSSPYSSDVVAGDFVNAAAKDFHLSAGSGLIGQGSNQYGTVSLDVDGGSWPSSGAWDIGFDRYGAAAYVDPVVYLTQEIPWGAQPPLETPLNADHPAFANGAYFFNHFGVGSGRDIAGGGYHTVPANAPAQSVRSGGLGLDFVAASSQHTTSARALTIPANSAFTFFVYASIDVADANIGRMVSLRSSSSANPIISMGTGNNGTGGNADRFSTLFRDNAGSLVNGVDLNATMTTNEPRLWWIRRTAAGALSSGIAGTQLGGTGTAAGALTLTADRMNYGVDLVNTALGYFDGFIYFGSMVPKWLSDEELGGIADQPWQLFEPQVIQTPIYSAAVAPTTFLTFSLSLAIQQAQALTASLSTAVQAPQSASAVADAAVQAARTAQASLDAAVQVASTAVADLSTAVQASGLQTASLNAALQLARSATLALDLAVQAHLSATASVNLQVQSAASATASVNLQVQAGSSASVSLSMAVLQGALSAVGLDLAVLRVGSQTAGVSAALQAARSAAAAIDFAIQAVRSVSASVNLQIQDGISALVGIDVAVQQARNAVAGVQLAIGQSAAASANVDAVAMLQRVVSAALGGAVTAARVASAGLSFYVDDGGVIVITGPIRLLAIISQELAFEATIEQA